MKNQTNIKQLCILSGFLAFALLLITSSTHATAPIIPDGFSAAEWDSIQAQLVVDDTHATAAWLQAAKLTANDGAAAEYFGGSVAVDGDTAVIGAPNSNNDKGAVYIFTRSDGIWSQQQKLTVSDGEMYDSFGFSVALDEDTAVISAPNAQIGDNSDQGAAYVFVRSGGTWSQQQKLTANDGMANNYFSGSVAISGDTAIIGASNAQINGKLTQGAAYVFSRTNNYWSQQQKLTASDGDASHQFGWSVALDGETALIGARGARPNENINQGAAYIFVHNINTWSQQQKLTASDGATNNYFGWSVALDGETAVIGAMTAEINSNQEQGAAYVFTRSVDTWSQQQKLVASDGTDHTHFGWSVAVQGNTVVVGVPDAAIGSHGRQGAAYVFNRSSDTWSQQQKLTANDGMANDQFGRSVTASDTDIIVGAYNAQIGDNNEQGAVYTYTLPNFDWHCYLPLVNR